MNPIDKITRRIELVQARSAKDADQDIMLSKVQTLLKDDDMLDQLMVLMAYQNSIILELAQEDPDTSATLWDICRVQSAALMKAFFKKKRAGKELN